MSRQYKCTAEHQVDLLFPLHLQKHHHLLMQPSEISSSNKKMVTTDGNSEEENLVVNDAHDDVFHTTSTECNQKAAEDQIFDFRLMDDAELFSQSDRDNNSTYAEEEDQKPRATDISNKRRKLDNDTHEDITNIAHRFPEHTLYACSTSQMVLSKFCAISEDATTKDAFANNDNSLNSVASRLERQVLFL
ncbi:hypothetical protein ACA910_014490 [Epithemia clementina (nom. ined.)]